MLQKESDIKARVVKLEKEEEQSAKVFDFED